MLIVMNLQIKNKAFSVREILDVLIELLCLAVVFLLPLSFSIWLKIYNVFELNKLVIFRILLLFLLLLTISKLVFFVDWRRRVAKWRALGIYLKKYYLAPIFLLIALGLSLFFSLDWQLSFFGSYSRGQGLLTYIFYFLWLLLLSFNILTLKSGSLEERLGRLAKAAFASGFLVALYGILQILKLDPLYWTEPAWLTHRVFSTLGQPNFLASWLLLILPLGFYLYFKSRFFWWRLFYGGGVGLFLTCLFLTASRGALIAFILTLLLFLCSFFRSAKLSLFKKIFFLSLAILGVAIIFWGLEKTVPGRLASFLNPQRGSFAARINFYAAASDAIIKRPLFGYGLENSGEIFIRYYEPEWGLYGGIDTSTDRAHNLILDILLTTGFWGLLFFTVFYFFFFQLVFKNIKEGKNPALSLALGLAGAAYLLSLLFGFTIIAGEVYFWAFFALLIVINAKSAPDFFETTSQKKDPVRLAAIFLVAGIISWLVYGNLRVLMADQYFNKIYYSLAEKDYPTTSVLLVYLENCSVNPVAADFYERFLGDKLSDFYPTITELVPKKFAYQELDKIYQNLPDRGYENLLAKGKVALVLGKEEAADKYLAAVSKITAHWPRVYLEEAKLRQLNKQAKRSLVFYRLAAGYLPAVDDNRLAGEQKEIVHYYLYVINRGMADNYLSLGDYAAAGKHYQLAYAYNPGDFLSLRKIADTYYFRHDLSQAIKYNYHGYHRQPEDFNWLVALAALYREQGDKEAARFYLEKALRLAPENEWLKQLEQEYRF